MNSEREKILGRIREALRVAAPPPQATLRMAATAARTWLPEVGRSAEEQWTMFAQKAADLKASLVCCDSLAEAETQLAALSQAQGWQRIATHGNGLAAGLAAFLKLPMISTDDGYDVAALEACSVGITECDALVAQTGSVLLTSQSGGGRALSVLPPHHVVIARRAQLVPDLPAAYALLQERYAQRWPSLLTFITGPSRTGDIERILVLGAHGPKALTIFVVP